ncbi:7486_t:CDS:1 [Paraglomus brasilianum]|uniref:7486_t:CDS:1 n=1 Tax=Paraglomus brasilianum TaxID=144538 RepID=A0A9N8W0B1_9GLOM|nr:7486_t:CDS:1 [Paraglomus brasilianum]
MSHSPDLGRVNPQPLLQHSLEHSQYAFPPPIQPYSQTYSQTYSAPLKPDGLRSTFLPFESSYSASNVAVNDRLSSVSFINTIYQKKKLHEPPNYEFTQAGNGQFLATLNFFGKTFQSIVPRPKKQDAKEEVARIAVGKLQQMEPRLVEEIQRELERSNKTAKPQRRMETSTLKCETWLKKQDKNKRPCVSLLEFCQTFKFGTPVYKQSHDFQGNYIFEVEVGSKRFKSTHAMFSKKEAQDLVAKVALDALFQEQQKKEHDEQEMFKIPKYSPGLAGRDVFSSYYAEDEKFYDHSGRQSCSYAGTENVEPAFPTVSGTSIPGCAPIGQLFGQPVERESTTTSSSYYSVPIGVPMENARNDDRVPFPPSLTTSGLGPPPRSEIVEPMTPNMYMPHMPTQHPPTSSTHNMPQVFMSSPSQNSYYMQSPFGTASRSSMYNSSYTYSNTPKKRYVSLLYEAAQARKWEAPNFTMHSTSAGGFLGEVRFMGHIFCGRTAFPKKAEAKENVSELAYKFYVDNLNKQMM